MKTTLVALGFAASVSAAISESCLAAIGAIGSSVPGQQCFNGAGLAPLADLPSDASLVPPIDSWLTELCANPPDPEGCNNATIGPLTANITGACGPDLQGFGLSASTLNSLIGRFFGLGLQSLCTKYNQSQFCLTSELNTLQSSLSQSVNLTTSNIISAIFPALGNATTKNRLVCSDCVAGNYAIWFPALEAFAGLDGSVKKALDDSCGNGFAGTSTQSDVQVFTGTYVVSHSASSTAWSPSGAERAAGLSLAGMLWGVGFGALSFVGSTVVGAWMVLV